MGVEAVIATQVIDTTSVGRAVMTAANAAVARSAIGAGTSSFDGAYSSLSGIPSTFAPSSHTHTTADITGFGEAVDDEVATLLVAGTNISITYNDAANTLTIASTASGLSGTGSVDNAVLRADGTGGATLQSSAIVIDDLFTTSPNNTVNFVCLKPTGGTTNVGVAIVPKGSGAFTLAVPDGTATGGNARGANAVDLQTSRSSATQVASGAASIAIGSACTASQATAVAIGGSCTASGTETVSIGSGNTSANYDSVTIGKVNSAGFGGVSIGWSNTSPNTGVAIGQGNGATGVQATAIGAANTASATNSIATGANAVADRLGQRSHTGGRFAANGDAQNVLFVLRNRTTNNTPTTLFLDGSSTRLVIPAGKILFANVMVAGIRSDGVVAACYQRKVAIKRIVNATSLVGTVETIGTDVEDNASADLAITADDTNEALQINVTGITGETWRWVAVVEGLEIAFGT